MDVTAAMMICLTPASVNDYSHNAGERKTPRNRDFGRHGVGTTLGTKDDELRENGGKMLPASDISFLAVRGHHRVRLHSARGQFSLGRCASSNQGLYGVGEPTVRLALAGSRCGIHRLHRQAYYVHCV